MQCTELIRHWLERFQPASQVDFNPPPTRSVGGGFFKIFHHFEAIIVSDVFASEQRFLAIVVFHNPPSTIHREVPEGNAQETANFLEIGLSNIPDEIVVLSNGQNKPAILNKWSKKNGDYIRIPPPPRKKTELSKKQVVAKKKIVAKQSSSRRQAKKKVATKSR